MFGSAAVSTVRLHWLQVTRRSVDEGQTVTERLLYARRTVDENNPAVHVHVTGS